MKNDTQLECLNIIKDAMVFIVKHYRRSFTGVKHVINEYKMMFRRKIFPATDKNLFDLVDMNLDVFDADLGLIYETGGSEKPYKSRKFIHSILSSIHRDSDLCFITYDKVELSGSVDIMVMILKTAGFIIDKPFDHIYYKKMPYVLTDIGQMVLDNLSVYIQLYDTLNPIEQVDGNATESESFDNGYNGDCYETRDVVRLYDNNSDSDNGESLT